MICSFSFVSIRNFHRMGIGIIRIIRSVIELMIPKMVLAIETFKQYPPTLVSHICLKGKHCNRDANASTPLNAKLKIARAQRALAKLWLTKNTR